MYAFSSLKEIHMCVLPWSAIGMQRPKVLICKLYAFSCNIALNKHNNNNFGINCFLIFLKSAVSPIGMVVQQSALCNPNEYVCGVCVCVCFITINHYFIFV